MDAMFCDKAQPIWKHLNIKALEWKSGKECRRRLTMYMKKDIINIGRRPYCSDNGPQSKGPTQ
jgi:hypothetical protein